MKRLLSLGKRRGLWQCADPTGTFCILALDHRRVVREKFATHAEAVQFKKDVVTALAPAVTAVLLDPVFGAGPAVADDTTPGGLGLVVAVEETGYEGPSLARVSRVAKGWGVSKIKRMGASAVKFLVYYHPDASPAPAMRDLVERVADECRRVDIALFLEPLSYSIDPDRRAMSAAEKRRVVVQTAFDLSPLGADVLKVEFPLDTNQEKDEKIWADACAELSNASQIPWVLLSASVDYETFQRQTVIACEAGASGILAGRSIWKEALEMQGQDRAGFLNTLALERMQKLAQICLLNARSYKDSLETERLHENWSQEYPGLL